MRTKVFLIVALCITLLLVVSCSSYKAKESQNTATPQPTATSAPDTAASQPAAQSSAPPAAAAPKPKAPYTAVQPTDSAAKAEAPVAPPTPAPTPTPPVVIPAGTTLGVRTTGPITSGTSQAKQQFEASLAKPLMVGNTVVVPKGAPVTGTIPQSESAGRIQGAGHMVLVLTSLTVKGRPYQISTKPVLLESKGRGKRSALMIGGGGGAGALIGGLAGGGKGAAIGAVAGAGAGTAGATLTGKRDMALPAETFLNFTLSKPLVLPPVQGGQADQGSSGLQDRSPGAQSPKDAQDPQSSQPPAPPAQGSPSPQQRPPN